MIALETNEGFPPEIKEREKWLQAATLCHLFCFTSGCQAV